MPDRIIPPEKLTEERKLAMRTPEIIYDKDKAEYYRDIQNLTNTLGIAGQSRLDPATPEGQRRIQARADYTRGALGNIGAAAAGAGILGATARIVTKGSELRNLLPYIIGQGAEAVVVRNSPGTVAKITHKRKGEMLRRNGVPNFMPLRFEGYVTKGLRRLPAFTQRKVRVLTEKTFPKHIGRLDKAMEKKGFSIIEHPNSQYRAYTNGTVVLDDIAPGNTGLDWLGRPRIIDLGMQSLPEWLAAMK